jgi:metal-dependent amidase/aminoacylase/carboxypeptidase family protein
MLQSYRQHSKGRVENPAIDLIVECDALPELGHACGHNIIAASAVGAAMGLSEILDDIDGGSVFGTPNEEGSSASGKGLADLES